MPPINLSMPDKVELKPRIVVIGVGGAGGNAVNNMIKSGLDGVEFVVANTDAQALALSSADRRIQIGADITQGLGSGMRPEVGEKSAENSMTEILEHLDGAHMLFIAAGMGGGTGTGAAPVIARAARERGILTVAIVTKPFQFEGSNRMILAEEGIERLQPSVDTLITIPNQNLFRIANEATTMTDAFALADEVLYSGVRSVTDLMVVPGVINLDFADVRTVMNEMGKAMMGTGEATGDRRAVEAAESAISNPLLDDVSLRGAKGVLINITGGKDLTLYEVDEAASLIRAQVDPDANIIVGSALDNDLEGIVRVSVVATGVEADEIDYQGRNAANSYTRPVSHYDEAETVIDDAPVADIVPLAPSQPVAPAPVAVSPNAAKAHVPETLRAPQAPAPAPVQQPITEPAPAPVQAAPVAPAPAPATPTPAPAPAAKQTPPEPVPSAQQQTVFRSPFSLWGRKKSVPIAKQRTQPQPAKAKNTGDLFGSDHDEELEIPSFLRRQNR